MSTLIGLAVALVLGWVFHRVGTTVRARSGIALGRPAAIGVGVVVAMAVWFALRTTTDLPNDLVNAMGIGPAVGLGHSLYKQ